MKKYILIFASISIFGIYNLQAQVNGAILQGNNVVASGQYSSAIGNQTQATGLGSFAGGRESVATKNYTMAFGNFCQATGHYAISLGSASIANADNAISIGVNTTASGVNAMSFGQFVKATGTNSIALGRGYLTTELTNGISNSFIVSFNSTNATLFVGPNNSGVSSATGNVGIATTAPGSKLQINGNAAIGYSSSTAAPTNGLAIAGNVGIGTNNPIFPLMVKKDQATYTYIASDNNNTPGANVGSGFAITENSNIAWYMRGERDGTGKFNIGNHNGNQLTISDNGKVGVGVDDFGGDYRFAVRGKILAEGVNVELFDRWPDYVFSKDYKLMAITEVEQFIKQHGHLPEIPNAAEMQKTGIDLGAMNVLLTKKMEEMMLYIIELKNENQAIKTQLSDLKK